MIPQKSFYASSNNYNINASSIIVDFDYFLIPTANDNEFLVQFINKSMGAQKYYWHFGDGTKSDEKNPKKIYEAQGYYTVNLTARFEGEIESATKTVKVIR